MRDHSRLADMGSKFVEKLKNVTHKMVSIVPYKSNRSVLVIDT